MSGKTGSVLLLGGNVGLVIATMDAAELAIGENAGTIRSRSRDHWTLPWGFEDDRLFLNRALLITTDLEPNALLGVLLGIEANLGRTRPKGQGYSARSIDIDILLFGDRIIDTVGLRVPHPRLPERAFALGPAADIVPLWTHPERGRTILELLDDLRRSARRGH